MTVGSQVKSCYSSVKSIDAVLSSLAARTQNEESKRAFADTQELITEIKSDLQKQVIQLTQHEPQYK